MARVLLGVTGGIAAYKACELVRLLVKAGHDVLPLRRAAPSASSAPRRSSRSRASRRATICTRTWTRADLLVIAPLTANTLAKLAHGLADNVLTEAALAHRGPVLVAPAMNARMWEHPATQANVATLRERGVELIGPEEGELAEGEVGARADGRAGGDRSPRSRSCSASARTRARSRAQRVLVTAGGTREPLDAVRFLGNRSSGRMGVALAAEARRRGADVTLLAANLAVPAPAGVEVVETPTAADLEREALAPLGDADVVVMAAAVADYRPAEPLEGKRAEGRRGLDARARADRRTSSPQLGEQRAQRPGARRLRRRAGRGGARAASGGCSQTRTLDLVVFNDVSRTDIGFDVDDNEVVARHARRRARAAARRRRSEIAAGDPRRGRAPARGASWRRGRDPAAVASSARDGRAARREPRAASSTRRTRRSGSASSASSPRGT